MPHMALKAVDSDMPSRISLLGFVFCCCLVSARTVPQSPITECPPGNFMCKKEVTCIPEFWRCDGIPDCLDNSDEPVEECKVSKRHRVRITGAEGQVLVRWECPPNQYRCPGTTTCIPISKICDGQVDCARDSADEGYNCHSILTTNPCFKMVCPVVLAEKSSLCKPSMDGPLCYCPNGYRISDNGKTCVDLNECLYDVYCDQNCTNTNGSYSCSCYHGYADPDNKNTCIARNIPSYLQPTLLYQTLNGIHEIYLNGTRPPGAFSLDQPKIQAMDFDHENGSICWIQMSVQSGHSDTANLMCASIKNSNHKWRISTTQSLNNVEHMALDWVTKNWYLTDKTAGRVLICSYNGSMCRTLIYLHNEHPSLIRVDPSTGYMFLTTTGSTPKILRMLLDGSEQRVLVEKALTRPRGLTLDYANQHVYWSDNRFSRIQRVNYDGTKRLVIVAGSWVNNIYSLTLLENWMYGADPHKGTIVKFSRHRHISHLPITVKTKLNYTASIYLYHRRRQPRAFGGQACEQSPCEHFCLPVFDRKSNKPVARCLCLEGYELVNDTLCEEAVPDQLLLYSSSRIGMIRGIDPRSGEDVIPPIDGLDGPVALAFHAQTQFIYYSLVFHGKIGRRKIDGSERNDSFMAKGIRKCEGLAIDWINHNIFWTDKVHKTINVAKLSDPTIRTVVVKLLNHPRVIAVDPVNEYIYWTDWSSEETVKHEARIEQARLDGSERRVLTSGKSEWLYWPNGITLDNNGTNLYWAEAYYNRIWKMDVVRNVSEMVPEGKVVHPFALTYSEHSLYWTELSKIRRLDLTNKTAVTTVKNDSSGLFDVKMYDPSSQPPGESLCADSVCSDLCLGQDLCLCATGRRNTTANATHCEADPAYNSSTACSNSEFKCVEDGSCIDSKARCNGVRDCPTGSDEDAKSTCTNFQCPDSNMFQCSNYRCVPIRWLCDGEDDCRSGKVEDEDRENCNNTACPANYTRCIQSRRCIPESWLCDHDFDCADHSDESQTCQYPSCDDTRQFHCENNRCISQGFVCNRNDDCGDGSDELQCRSACNAQEFKCESSGRCLLKTFVCDGVDHCGDNADERNCDTAPTNSCHDKEFRCDNGECIPLPWQCDGSPDCEDHSDESLCNNTDSSGHVPCPDFGCTDTGGDYRCFTRASQCDGIKDCMDNRDETNCTTDLHCPWPKWECDAGQTCLDITKVCDTRVDCSDSSDEGLFCDVKLCETRPNRCSHFCASTPDSYRCYCPSGMTLDPANNSTCIVSEPCVWGTCSQTCIAEGTKHRCSCLDGYALESDHFTCKSTDRTPAYIIFSNRHEIRRLDLHGSSYVSLLSALPNTIALEFHYEKSYVFWTDVNEDAIHRGMMRQNSMTNVEVIVRVGLSVTEGLAVDWVADNIYWVESQLDLIEVANIDGSNQTTLIAGNMVNPRAIVLDPRQGLLFWTDWHPEQPRIERCSMNGEDRRVIYNVTAMTDAGWPNGMTVDFVAFRLYWIDARSHSIHTIRYDGSDHRLVLKDHGLLSHPFAISLYENMVYWTDWKTNSLIQGNKWTGRNVSQIQRTITQPFDLQVYHSSRQPKAYNPCAQNNGGCSHICLINAPARDGADRRSRASCKCPMLMKMASNGVCVDYRKFLLYAKPKEIRGVDLDRAYYNVIPAMTSFVMKPSSVDYDPRDEMIYWTDLDKNAVNRAFINTSTTETIVDADVPNPGSIAVDWISRNIYFTSIGYRSAEIYVSRLDGAYRIQLDTHMVLIKPTSLVLHPREGSMFLADIATEYPGILVANMDGSEMRQLKQSQHAKGLAIDYATDRLYWISRSMIHSCTTDGGTYRFHAIPTGSGPLRSLTVYKNHVYYAQDDSVIVRARINGSHLVNPVFIRNNTANVVDMGVYDADSKPDSDDTPCQSNGGCTQLCLPSGRNQNGQKTKVCRCTAGYHLGSDLKTCEGIHAFLLYATSTELIGRLLTSALPALPPISNISNISAIDYDAGPGHNSIFWVNSKTAEINRIGRDLTGRKTIIKGGLDIVEGIAVDWSGNNIYWADQGLRRIQVARTDGQYRYVLISSDLERPRSIVVHPSKGLLFWTDGGLESMRADTPPPGPRIDEQRYPRIERSTLDGRNRMVIYNATDGQLPYSLALDTDGHRLYWCDYKRHNLHSMKLDGTQLRTVRANVTSCFDIAVFNGKVYWVSREAGTGLEKKSYIMMTLSDGTGKTKVVTSRLGRRITDLKVYRTPDPTFVNPCLSRPCEQLCFFNGSSANCACAHGKLSEDGVKCVDHEAFLLFSSISQIESIHLLDFDNKNAPLQVIRMAERMKNVIGLAFHYATKRVFFSDIQRRDIQSVFLNGTGFKVLVKEVGSAEGLAYDEVYDRLYWTSYTHSSIHAIDLSTPNATVMKVVTLSSADHPRAIVIDSCKARIFWTNWNSQQPRIQRSYLEGSNIENVITTDISIPNGLTIDHQAQKLYWSDARLDKVERCDLDGRHRVIVVSRGPQHGFALAVHGQYLYWTDWMMSSVVQANKLDGSVIRTLRKTEQQPMGIIAVANDTNDCSLNPCSHGNGGCAELCQVNELGISNCGCYDNKVLGHDGKTCEVKCPSVTDFVCGPLCVPIELTCNGNKTCADGSDEDPDYCNARLCPQNYYRCANNSCIPWHQHCDGVDNCGDNSDELGCVCPRNTMLCSPSMPMQCIDRASRCDGHPDCPLGQDEMHCNQSAECLITPVNQKEMTHLIPCNTTTACISPSWRCDGENDCWDNSDEQNCNATTSCAEDEFRCPGDGKCISSSWKCDRTADCNDHSDEKGCVFNCTNAEFQCNVSNLCIPSLWECDGQTDCEDGSDEHDNCDHKNCPKEYIQCANSSQCIAKELICDGLPDCADNSDEDPARHNCTPQMCKPHQFQCHDGPCIHQHFHCDHYKDCQDGSDELQCDYLPCTSSQFRCTSGQCVNKSATCNGRHECFDMSDETADMCPSEPFCQGRDQFLCPNGACIEGKKVCDVTNDCGDWADELACGINECIYKPCGDICEDRDNGFICKCRNGFKLAQDNSTCVDIDECQSLSNCSHYCMNTMGGYRCSCMRGFQLQRDRRSCKVDEAPFPYFVVTNRYYIRNVSIDGRVEILTSELTNAVAVDYDWSDKRIYWSDVTNQGSNISRMFFNRTGREVLHNASLRNPDGIALDWLGRNLYWCDKTTDTIEVSRLDGRFRKVLVDSGLQEPRALVVHPARGFLFYSDWGDRAHIGRLGMDGANRRDVVNMDIAWPNALTIDYVTDHIYWADARMDHIQMARLDGSGQRVVIRGGPNGDLPHLFALTVFGSSLYWTDWEHKSLESAHKYWGTNHTTLRRFIHRPMDVHVVHASRQLPSLTNPCEDNGECRNLCLIQAGGKNRTCGCPENHYLDKDGISCMSNCTASQFLCSNNFKCIPFWTFCDGQDDCGDMSDEPSTCAPYHCRSPGLFQCHDANETRHCIPPNQICDGLFHCEDKSDEHDCEYYTCLPNQFKCTIDAKCIAETKRCDNIPDCRGGEDEQNCPKPSCDLNEFMCLSTGNCIPYMWRCDGANDCKDGSDEPPNCKHVACIEGFFQCKNGQCLPHAWRCDGQKDCAGNDDTDEPATCSSVTCDPTYFKCRNNRCIPGRWKCDYRNDCGDYSDEIDCSPRNCSESEFRCESDGRCITGIWRCNGVTDCDDSSDERNCINIHCGPEKFQCRESRYCIPNDWHCDGEDDCSDNSDEIGCNSTCPNTQLKCQTSGDCIEASWRCDGTADCHDGSDEHNCKSEKCATGLFNCTDGSCVLYSQVCDGTIQCPDGSDERNCTGVGRRRCNGDQFRCSVSHQCVAKKNVCDKVVDCADGSDEDVFMCAGQFVKKCPECSSGHCYATVSNMCVCPRGQHLGADHKTCDKIERCRQYKRCDQRCRLSSPQHMCFCDKGFYLSHFEGLNATRCRPIGADTYVLASAGAELWAINMITMQQQVIFQLGDQLESVDVVIDPDVDLFVTHQLGNLTIFGINSQKNRIVSIQLNVRIHRLRETRSVQTNSVTPGIVKELEFDGTKIMTDLSVDWIGRRIYWTDSAAGRIETSDLDGNNRLTVIATNLEHVDRIVVSPEAGKMVWSQLGGNPRLERSNLDGSGREILFMDDLLYPTGLALDYPNKRIYWADMKKRTLETSNMDGSDRQIVKSFSRDEDAPYRLDVFGTFLYVSTYRHHLLIKMDKFNSSYVHTMNLPKLVQYVAIQPAKQKRFHTKCSSGNPCGAAMCISVPGATGYTCTCPNGHTRLQGLQGFECLAVTTPVLDQCTDQMCLNGGQCRTSEKNAPKCSCMFPFYGNRCQNSRCYGYCLNNSTCSSRDGSLACRCPIQYQGPRCAEQICTSFCHMNGQCVISPSGSPICRCNYDYTGKRCEVRNSEPCADFCLNGGTCIHRDRPICRCPPGSSGQRCEVCDSLTCANHGLCLRSSKPSMPATCSCLDGYTNSSNCRLTLCDGYCQNNGTCKWLGPLQPYCTCTSSRFHGDHCEKDNCPECLNGGRCRSVAGRYVCDCLSGYTGHHCQQPAPTCTNQYCKNGGTCLQPQSGNGGQSSSMKCQCLPGFGGKQCESIIDCSRLKCQNDGVCTVGKNGVPQCRCTSLYTGSTCSEPAMQKCMSYCFNDGSCEGCHIKESQAVCTSCHCPQGWTGPRCAQRQYVTKPGASSSKRSIAAISIPFVLIFIVLIVITGVCIRRHGYPKKQFMHVRMKDNGAVSSNMEINNPIYRPARAGDGTDIDDDAFTFDADQTTNFSNPLYGASFGDNPSLPMAANEETKELLDSDLLKVTFAGEDEQSNSRTSFA